MCGWPKTRGTFRQPACDGTLRALGVLVAVVQAAGSPSSRPISLIGIEEPEVAILPEAAGKLMDALHEAAHWVQIVITTHSPDLLDQGHVDPDQILAVEAVDGATAIGPIEDAMRQTIRDKLYTAGEVLRLEQMVPAESVRRAARQQLRILD